MGKIHKALEKSKKEKKQQQKKVFKTFKDQIESRQRNIDTPENDDTKLSFQPTFKNQPGSKRRPKKKQNNEHSGLEFQPTPGSKLGLIHPLLEDSGDADPEKRKKEAIEKLNTDGMTQNDKSNPIN